MDLQAGRPNALLKSKSSNTRVKPRDDEKKSKSSGEFKSLLMKKRGVYVEKRFSLPLPDPPQVVPPKVKAPPRSRPGAKPFLDSVLSILSKSTTGTQHPARSPKTSKLFQPSTHSTDDELDLWLLEQNTAVKKPKNKKGDNQKPKRDLTSRDLHYSKEKFKLKQKVASHNSEEARSDSKIEIGESTVDNSIIKGNKMNLEKEIQDPATLVNAAAKDEKLYSLFVNLLETAYNTKTDKDTPGLKNTNSFKTNAQKDDSFTKKETRRDHSPADKIFMNSRYAKVMPQPLDSKWRERQLEENIVKSTHKFEFDGKPSQTNVFEKVLNQPRYLSRFKGFTDSVYKELPEGVVPLKYKHDLRNHGPSSTSKDTDVSVKWADFLPKLVHSETGEVTKNDNTIDLENSIARSIMEGNRLNMEKETDTTTSGPEKEKKLYSLFVNLLESVYPDLQSPELFDEVNSQSSKLRFEHNAAQKLNDVIRQTNEYSQPPYGSCKPRKWHQRESINHINQRYPNDIRWSYRDDESVSPERRVKKKLKRHAHKQAEQRAPLNSRHLKKKNKKQELLSIIKQQLTKHDYTCKEPMTFYDALRIMARNMRNDFNDASLIRRAQEVGDDSDYDTQKRKPAQNTQARPMRYPKAGNRKPPASARSRNSRSEYTPPNYDVDSMVPPDSEDSYHSLAVYGYDYSWKPESSESSTSGEVNFNEVNYNWQSNVGSQCCTNCNE